MTSRRSIQTTAQRKSRAFQFVPGHVGGRVASAQPVRRRRTIGVAASAVVEPFTLRPDVIEDYDDQPVSYQGGGGQSTLRDRSDATFLRLDYTLGPPADFLGTPVATFETGSPTFVPAHASLTIRARSLSNTGGNRIGFNLSEDILPGGTYDPYFTDSNEVDDDGGWVPGSTWTDYTYAWDHDPSDPLYYKYVPTTAQVSAGGIQILVTPAITTSAAMQLDIADVWLVLS